MRKFNTAAALAVMGTLVATIVVAEQHRHTPPLRLQAEGTDPWQDTDGDLLPDALEWVTLTNPGRLNTFGADSDDFLDVVDYINPGCISAPGRDNFSDHSARLIVHGLRTATGCEDIYVNLLVRLVGTAPVTVGAFEPFLQAGSMNVPIASVLSSSREIRQASRVVPGKGTLLRFSFRLASVAELRPLLPCTIGASVVLDGKQIVSGSHLTGVGTTVAAVVVVDSEKYAFQALTVPQDVTNPFWRGNHACVFRLVQIGLSRTQSLCEVVRAECDGVVTLYCDPQGCRAKEGSLVPLPIGIRLLRGG